MSTTTNTCPECGDTYEARTAELKRGWAQTCSKTTCRKAWAKKRRQESLRAQRPGVPLAMPMCGLSFADVSLAAMECHGNKTRTARRLGVSIKALEALIEREKIGWWFNPTGGIRHQRKRCVSKDDIVTLAQEGYTRPDVAHLLGISQAYLKDLISKWDLADSFIIRKGKAAAVTAKGYAWAAGRNL